MTEATICCARAPCGERLPPQTFRVTTAGRNACSARQLAAICSAETPARASQDYRISSSCPAARRAFASVGRLRQNGRPRRLPTRANQSPFPPALGERGPTRHVTSRPAPCHPSSGCCHPSCLPRYHPSSRAGVRQSSVCPGTCQGLHRRAEQPMSARLSAACVQHRPAALTPSSLKPHRRYPLHEELPDPRTALQQRNHLRFPYRRQRIRPATPPLLRRRSPLSCYPVARCPTEPSPRRRYLRGGPLPFAQEQPPLTIGDVATRHPALLCPRTDTAFA